MKEFNDELKAEVKDIYKKFAGIMEEKKELTSHNRAMKADFVDIHFEDAEAEEKKSIKKQITRYFEALDRIASGSDPVIEVKNVRKTHLDFEDDLYSKLMEIKKQIDENLDKKEDLDNKLDQLMIELCVKWDCPVDVTRKIMDEWYGWETGKLSILPDVVAGFSKVKVAFGAEG